MSEGELHVDWLHADACPARLISATAPAWAVRRTICTCSMPSGFELDTLHEACTEMWQKRVDAGEADP